MSWKQVLLFGASGALLAALAGVIYNQLYSTAFFVDFGRVLGPVNIIVSCTLGCFLMALGYKLMFGWKGVKLAGWINIVYSILSFASIAGVLGFNLPLDMESPEMFPGLAIPMHFFPALSMFAIFPFFKPLQQ